MPISLKTAIKSSYGDKKSKQKILNEGYVKDKKLPDAAIDLLDRTMSAIKMMNETSKETLEELQTEYDTLNSQNEIQSSDFHITSELKWFSNKIKNKVSPVLLGQLENSTDIDKSESIAEIKAYIEDVLENLKIYADNIFEKVTKQEIAAVISHKSGIPLGKIQAEEQTKLLNMEEILKKRV
jgi:ATP-dependent Clp protease ATP-binding subunit ClpA